MQILLFINFESDESNFCNFYYFLINFYEYVFGAHMFQIYIVCGKCKFVYQKKIATNNIEIYFKSLCEIAILIKSMLSVDIYKCVYVISRLIYSIRNKYFFLYLI